MDNKESRKSTEICSPRLIAPDGEDIEEYRNEPLTPTVRRRSSLKRNLTDITKIKYLVEQYKERKEREREKKKEKKKKRSNKHGKNTTVSNKSEPHLIRSSSRKSADM